MYSSNTKRNTGEKNEVYSFALKRLNQQDDTQIIITDFLISKVFPINALDIDKMNYLKICMVNCMKVDGWMFIPF